MSQFVEVRDLTAPEWIILAKLFQHSEQADRGDLGEKPMPMLRDALVEWCKPMEGLEPVANLAALGLVRHPRNKANQREMKPYLMLTDKGEAVFMSKFEKAPDLVKKRHAYEAKKPTTSKEVVAQQKRELKTLTDLLAVMAKEREKAQPKAEAPQA